VVVWQLSRRWRTFHRDTDDLNVAQQNLETAGSADGTEAAVPTFLDDTNVAQNLKTAGSADGTEAAVPITRTRNY
jgi:hypothetical protein